MPRFCVQIVYKCNSNYAIICGRQMKRDLHAGPPQNQNEKKKGNEGGKLQIDGAIEQIYIELGLR